MSVAPQHGAAQLHVPHASRLALLRVLPSVAGLTFRARNCALTAGTQNFLESSTEEVSTETARLVVRTRDALLKVACLVLESVAAFAATIAPVALFQVPPQHRWPSTLC